MLMLACAVPVLIGMPVVLAGELCDLALRIAWFAMPESECLHDALSA
jgi:hypothetical protein